VVVRLRLAALEDARWRGAHRDRLSRRLIPWVLAAARRAATERRQSDLARLDGLVSRLAIGMTAGEELRLEDLLARRAPLAGGEPQVRDGFGLDRGLEHAVRVAAQVARAEAIAIAGVRQCALMHPRL